MTIELQEDVRRQWLIATASGRLTIAHVLEFMKTARAPVERRMMPLLFDASGATTSITAEEIHDAVELARKTIERAGPRGHIALVADDDPLYESMLLYETLCADYDIHLIRVFRHRTDAEHWLQTLSDARHFR